MVKLFEMSFQITDESWQAGWLMKTLICTCLMLTLRD